MRGDRRSALDPEEVGVRKFDDFDHADRDDPDDHDDHVPDESEHGAAGPGPEDQSGPLGPPDTDWQLMLGMPRGAQPTPRPFGPNQGPSTTIPRQPAPPPQEPVDDQEHRGTSPLESPPADEHPLFSERYHTSGIPEPRQSAPLTPRAPGVGPARGHGAVEDQFGLMLQQRRLEDERLTGRRWPGAGQAYPADPSEVEYFQQLAVAMGEVDPRVLAREPMLRYVRASRIGGEDHLAPTDIFAILHFGLGLTLRQLNCTGLPHVLGVYYRAARELYLDWKLIQDPPYGRAVLDPAAWRRAVDTSPVARFLIAWTCAVHLTENYDIPLVLGFAPAPAMVAGTPALAPDTQNRYRKVMVATASLLAPAERLWQQITMNRLRLHMGDPDWREHMRTEYGHPAPGGRTSGGPATESDPAAQLVEMLAQANNCPPVLVEAQLDGERRHMEWAAFSQRLLHEIPVLQMRYVASSRMFGLAANNAPVWGATAPAPASPTVPVILAL
jgi:hypothetical protein